jgi:hypothetical protein
MTETITTKEKTTNRIADRIAGTSPLVYARIAGLLLLIVAVLGPFSLLYVPSTLFVPGDAPATADNIRASEGLFRLGIVSDSLIFLIEVVLTALLYVLLRPVSRTLSLGAAFARLAMAVIQGINLLPYFIALLLLSGAGYLTAVFEPDQLDALALLFLNAHQDGVYIWQMFFGLNLFVLGYLIFKSGYFPRILGLLMVVGALGYLLDAYGNILFHSYGETFGWVVGVTAVFGELPFFLWLVIKGVNVQRYNERAENSLR